ncbi:MAG TPA: AMP-binding protein, partial [Burkholderiaceae bacterium]|nr:AMP-binding protein [Burkholderiaceae bacterium]
MSLPASRTEPDRPHHAVWPSRLPRELVVPETSLWFNLEVSARRYPNKPACLFFGSALTYRDLKAQAEAVAGWLQRHGVAKGDRVLLYLQNCPQFLVAFYAILRADAVVVPVNPMNRADEFAHYITDPEARVAICAADLAPVVMTANAAVPAAQRLLHVLAVRYADVLPAGAIPEDEKPAPALLDWLLADPPLPAGCSRWVDALAAGLRPREHEARPDDLAVLPYTSGTTGLPKGCMHTHRTLMPNTIAGGMWGHASAERIGLAVVPMFHVTGMLYGVLSPVYLGMTTVVMPRWDRELAGRLISRHRVTH